MTTTPGPNSLKLRVIVYERGSFAGLSALHDLLTHMAQIGHTVERYSLVHDAPVSTPVPETERGTICMWVTLRMPVSRHYGKSLHTLLSCKSPGWLILTLSGPAALVRQQVETTPATANSSAKDA